MKNERRQLFTILLIAVNVILFFYLSFQGMTEDAEFMLEHGAMYVPYMMEGKDTYRLFTSMFLHFDLDHLMNNMLMHAVLGWNLEYEIGKVRFLIIYFGSGLAGNILSGYADTLTGDFAVSAGASGAVFGLVGALIYVAMRNKGQIGNLSGRGMLFMAGISLYVGFTSSNVDNLAHIGGLIVGFILAVLLYWKRKNKRRVNTWD